MVTREASDWSPRDPSGIMENPKGLKAQHAFPNNPKALLTSDWVIGDDIMKEQNSSLEASCNKNL